MARSIRDSVRKSLTRLRPESIRSRKAFFGITGHRDLTPETAQLVARHFRRLLTSSPDHPVGVTCLAGGSDQLLAQAVLDHGGTLDVIVPAADYRDHMSADDGREYDRLLAGAYRVTRLPYPSSAADAHMAASLVVVERSNLLVAVWDGRPSRGFAGTADVVAYARQVQVPVEVVWPPGAARTEG